MELNERFRGLREKEKREITWTASRNERKRERESVNKRKGKRKSDEVAGLEHTFV